MGFAFSIIVFVFFVAAAFVILWFFDTKVPKPHAPATAGATAPAGNGGHGHDDQQFSFLGFFMETLAGVMLMCAGYVGLVAWLPQETTDAIRKVAKGEMEAPEAPKASQAQYDAATRTITLEGAGPGLKWVKRLGQAKGEVVDDGKIVVPPGITVVDLWFLREKDHKNGAVLCVPTPAPAPAP